MSYSKDFTKQECLIKIAEIHPYSLTEIRKVFDRCGSVDETIRVVVYATEAKITLMDTCELLAV